MIKSNSITLEMRKQICEEFSNPSYSFKISAVNELENIGETCVVFSTLFDGSFQAYFDSKSKKLKTILKVSSL